MSEYVYRDGSRLTPAMLRDINLMDSAFHKDTGYRLLCTSGIRTRTEQGAIFFARYVPATQVGGRRVYDYRSYQGRLWARVSPAGTVLPPDSPAANHVLENTGRGAVDFRDNGPNPGVASFGTARTAWMHKNAGRWGFYPEGVNFNEAWHYKYLRDPWAKVAAPPAETDEEEIEEMAGKSGTFLVSYESKSSRNGLAIASLDGRWYKLTGEQWKSKTIQKMLAGVERVYPGNDREYDIIKAMCSQ